MTELQTKRCAEILQHYGVKPQRRQLCEECAELIQAICKLDRYGQTADECETALHNFIEELADVEIMVEQMKLSFTEKERDRLLKIETAKINRQLRRITKGEN